MGGSLGKGMVGFGSLDGIQVWFTEEKAEFT